MGVRERQRLSRDGMTAIELLAASSLAALLMIAVLGVLASLSTQRRLLESQREVEPWRRRLAEQLYWDLANARRMDWQPDQLRLNGYGGRDFASRRATHHPTEVTYRVRHEGQHSWLVRQETHLDAGFNPNAQTELVCAGVTRFEVQLLDTRTDWQQDREIVPERVRLVLHGELEGRPVLDRVFLFSRPRTRS